MTEVPDMNPDLIGIAARCSSALRSIQRGELGAASRCEQIITHDVTSLIAAVGYLRRRNAILTSAETALIPKPPDHG